MTPPDLQGQITALAARVAAVELTAAQREALVGAADRVERNVTRMQALVENFERDVAAYQAVAERLEAKFDRLANGGEDWKR